MKHGDSPLTSASFSPDGNLILTTSADGTARVWDSANGELLTCWRRHDSTINHGEFSPANSRLFATAGDDNSARLWRLTPWPHSVEELADLAQVLYGQELGPRGSLSVIEPRLLAARLESLRSKHPELSSALSSEVREWHQEMAGYASRYDQWPAAIWHLNKVLSLSPKDVDTLTMRGNAYAERARWPEARQDFQAALNLDRQDPDHWENLADTFLALQDLPSYRKLCAEALAYAQNQADLYSVRNLVELGGFIPAAVADQDKAVKLVETALAARPSNPVYARSHGIVLYRAGRFQEAVAELERQRHLPPINAPDLLGMIFLALGRQKTGKVAEAQALWQQVTSRAQKWSEKKVSESGPDWKARTTLQLLRKEAESAFGPPGQRNP